MSHRQPFRPDQDLRTARRMVALLRILFLVLALAVLTTLSGLAEEGELVWLPLAPVVQNLLLTVALVTGLLVMAVPWMRRRWMILLSMVFDLAWLGTLIYLTGGVSSPVAPLMPALVLVSSLVLPGAGHVVMPLIGAGLLTASAITYLTGWVGFEAGRLPDLHPLIYPPRVVGNLVVQIGALFLVDVLGQALARRLHEQRLVTGGLIDQIGEGVVAMDRDRFVLYGNGAAEGLLGCPPIAPGQAIEDLLGRADLAPLRQAIADGVVPFAMRLRTDDDRDLNIRVGRLVGRRGRMIGSTLLVSDETQLRELERDANRSERLASLGEMAAGIAHEVRNPLASLRGCAQELVTILDQADRGDQSQLASIIVAESDRLATLVEDFLGLSRLRHPELVGVDLEEEFEQLQVLCEARRDHGVTVAFSMGEDTPWVAADPGQLRQVLTNLINNALEAVTGVADPQVEVGADPVVGRGGFADELLMVAIVVRDNGCGILPDRLEEIFTPFYSSKGQGTGLGLTLVQHIVAAHRASIEVSSEPGAGTTMRLLWPAWEGAQDD